jgi:hypothetical protein
MYFGTTIVSMCNPAGEPKLGDKPMKIQHISNSWLEWDTIVVTHYKIYPKERTNSGNHKKAIKISRYYPFQINTANF